jgi:protein-S-isoprenylcysteine O-methyltransferase Ste14
MKPPRDNAGVFVPPPLLYVVPFVAGIFLHRGVGHDAFPAAVVPVARIAGIAMAVTAVTLALIANHRFHRAGTSALPFRPATAIVTDGPYRFTRNPMYLALALLYLGLTLIAGYAWPFACFPLAVVAVDRFVIPREERYLEQEFGDPYRRYREAVHRWL